MQQSIHSLGKVDTVRVEGATQIRLSGECDMALVPELRTHLERLLETRPTRVVFDLERVTFLDSSVLNIFLQARRAGPSGQEVVLLLRPGFVRRLLTLLEMDSLLTVCTPEEWRQRTVSLQ